MHALRWAKTPVLDDKKLVVVQEFHAFSAQRCEPERDTLGAHGGKILRFARWFVFRLLRPQSMSFRLVLMLFVLDYVCNSKFAQEGRVLCKDHD